jgi:hypothetical protein
MSITNLTSPYSTQYQVSSDDIDLVKIRSKETSPLTHEDLDDNFANLMNKVNELVGIIGGTTAAVSVDAGKVGIGNNNPSHDLTLGSATSTGTTSERLKIYRGQDDSGQNLEMGFNHITVTRDANTLADPQSTFAIKQRGSDGERTAMHIDPAGNVGIGTVNPGSYRLQISSGDLGVEKIVSVVTASENMVLANPTTEAPYLKFDGKNSTKGLNWTFGVVDDNLTDEKNLLAFNRYNDLNILQDTPFIIDSDGKVGIGTTIPSAKLHIEDTNANLPGIKISASDQDYEHELRAGGDGMIISADSTNYGGVGPDIRLMVSGSEHMRIIKSGNVGIGTTNPGAKLHVKLGANGLPELNASLDTATALRVVGGDNAVLDMGSSGASGTWIQSRNQSTYNLQYDLLLQPLGGNVGIGTTNPGARLDIIDAQRISTIPEVPASGQLRLSNISTNGGTWGIHTTANGWNAGGGGKLGFFADDNSNQARMMITQAGNVGIGTESPDFPLDIVKKDVGVQLQMGRSDSNSGSAWMGADSNGFHLGVGAYGSGNNVSGPKGITVDTDGNFGIGTVSPGSNAGGSTLNPSIDFGGKIVHIDNDAGAASLAIGSSTQATLIMVEADAPADEKYKALRARDGKFQLINLRDDSSLKNIPLTCDSDGNVGIGTTSPGHMLEIKTNEGDKYGVHVTSDYGSSLGGLYVRENGLTNDGLDLYLKTGSVTTARISSTSSVSTFFNAGNVGIGTTNPSSTLQVVGSLSKSSGSFRIDHPVKPETHDLVHSFVEAPQADNIYRGKVDLMNGKAEVDIDAVAGMTEGTFVALNREIQVFTSNETDWSAVRGRVDGNKLIIDSKNNQSTATISWLVIGERKDKHMYDTEWTDENGKVIVEPLKPEPIPEPEISPEPEPEPYVAEDIIAKDGKEYIRIGDKDYEVLGKNEDGSLLLDDDVTNNG